MSKDQKGFIVYGNHEEILDRLTDEEAGKLLKAMTKYFNHGTEPKFDGALEFVWIPIRQQMDANAEKYEAKCQKNREKIQKYWDGVKKNTNVNNSIQMYSNATNTNTKTKTNTKTDTDTDTTTNTDTKASGGGGGCGDEFDLWKKLTPDDIDRIYDAYPDSGGFLIEEVVADVKRKQKKVENAASYILGYAKRVGWDDKAEHGTMPWEVS